MSEKFDASKYLRKLNGKDYLEVKWRLLWVRTEHPDALITTHLAKHEPDGPAGPALALFRAEVTLPGGGQASGWGSETSSDFADYIEKAETKALGRALAALGYGTQFCEDFDFSGEGVAVGAAPHVVDAPVRRPRTGGGQVRRKDPPGRQDPSNGAPARPAGGQPQATAAQVRAIYSIAGESPALGEKGVDGRCQAAYGCLPSELTRRQASEFIDSLKGQRLAGVEVARQA
jgi:hypothetical protein